MDGLQLLCLDEEDKVGMERPFLEEVVNALNDLTGDKAPGLDGFTMAFLFRNVGEW